MKSRFAALTLALAATAASALPAVTDVEAEVRKGNYKEAQTMMQEVVAARPGSARAHYVYAEILARNARFDDAAREAALAKQLDPALKFAEPEKFRAFEQLLNREQQRASSRSTATSTSARTGSAAPASPYAEPAAPRPSGGVPGWAWAAGLGVLGLVAWRMAAKRRAASGMAPMAGPAGAYGGAPGQAVGPGYGGAAAYGPGYGPGGNFGPGGYAGNRGGNLMGMGLAAAGGVAAGMFAEKMLSDRGHDAASGAAGLEPGAFGNDPGAFDDPAARALEERPVDFGAGNGWDDGGGADMGSADAGGDGGGDGW